MDRWFGVQVVAMVFWVVATVFLLVDRVFLVVARVFVKVFAIVFGLSCYDIIDGGYGLLMWLLVLSSAVFYIEF